MGVLFWFRCLMNSMMPPLYRNVWLRPSRSSSMTIFRPLFRKASSRSRFDSVSNENVGLLEDRRVRLEPDDRAVLLRRLARRQRAGRRAALLVALGPHLAAAPDLDLEPLAERVDDRDADAVQTARDLVGRVLELAAGVQDGQHDLGRRLAASPCGCRRGCRGRCRRSEHGAVGVQDDLDRVAVAAERFVDRVVDGLVDEVVQTVGARVADVHGGALADRLQALEHLDVARGVASQRSCGGDASSLDDPARGPAHG